MNWNPAAPRPSFFSSLLDQLKRLRQIGPLIHQLTSTQLTIILTPISLLIMTISTCAVLSSSDVLPPPDQLPRQYTKPPEVPLRLTPTYYRATIESASQKLGQPLTVEQIQEGLAYRIEFDGSQTLLVGRTLQTKSLQLKLALRNLWIGEAGRGFRAQHLTLAITNKLTRPIAYRVETELDHPCRLRSVLPHNAVALLPGKTAERTECLQRDARSLRVTRCN